MLPVDDDDPLTVSSPPGVLWSRVNFVEAAPGVLMPAGWSFYGEVMEVAGRKGFSDMGAIPWSLTVPPDDMGRRLFGVFSGYPAINVGAIRSLMGGLPGISGDDVERDMLGSARDGVVDERHGWRLPAVLGKMPVRIAQLSSGPARFRAASGEWWTSRVDTSGLRPGVDPRGALAESLERFGEVIRRQSRGRLFLQGAASALSRYAEQIGAPHLAGQFMAGTGTIEEIAVADDLFALSQGQLDMATFLARHGFHGPNAGAVQARSWREDPSRVERILPTLRESESPRDRRARLVPAREDAVATLLSQLPRKDRVGARLALKLAPTAATSLERTKAAMLLSLDVARAAIRAIGAELTAAGLLEDPEDAFQFFADELLAAGDGGLRERATRRNAARQRYLASEVPESWEGQPVVTRRTRDTDRERATTVSGLGVGSGVVEGPVRVVLDPDADVDIQGGEILVCPTTDPSWVALMTIAGGLVIDIGGAVSHGALIAREIGIPCVIGTHTGTVDLRDGDLVRVDAARGIVEVLEPADASF